jgi:K+/H+ antiporter YhaU regulatory subunit KhtT
MMEQRYAKVEGYSNIIRDLKTNAIINTDVQGMQSYISSKNKRLNEKRKIDSIENDVSDLKSSMEEIKMLLKGLLNES